MPSELWGYRVGDMVEFNNLMKGWTVGEVIGISTQRELIVQETTTYVRATLVRPDWVRPFSTAPDDIERFLNG